MTQTPLNIFDLMMGGIKDAANKPAGQAVKAGEAAGLFGDILGACINGEGKIDAALMGPDGKFDLLAWFASKGISSDSDPLATGETALQGVPENVAELGRQLMAMLPQQMPGSSLNFRDAVEQLPVELEDGKYEIIDARVKDGKVSLLLVAKDNPGRTFTMSLPRDLIEKLPQAQVGHKQTDTRISLGADTYNDAKLDKILSQLNLTEIEVDASAGGKQAAEVTKPINMVFTAKTSVGEQLLRTSADRNRIRVTSSDGPSARVSSLSESRPVGVAEAVKTTAFELMSQHQLGQETTARQQLAMLAGKAGQSDTPDIKQNWSQSADNQQLFESIMGYDASRQDNSRASEAKSDIQTARFVLPNDLGAHVKPNGQSVMLRIQPENLGTARLNLTMSGDKLKARITVESVPAKLALESNLDRLVNDLKQANIQVDHIDISVSGESANNELWGRQPHWRHRMVSRAPRADVLTSEEMNITVPPPAPISAGYVGASGVNLLA